MEKKIIIIGAGAFSREVLWLIEEINSIKKEWEILGFLDDSLERKGKIIHGKPVLGKVEDLKNISEDVYSIVTIANGNVREKVVSQFKNRKFATLIHPNVNIDSSNFIGEGTIICSGNIITVDINIGKHVIVNLSCTIGHDAIISDYVTIFPGVNISGGVFIGKNSSIGTGTAILQYLKVGENTTLGSLSNVIRDIPDYCTAVGNPAKIIKKYEK
ncbi:acetyltransferase [Fusobacterium russii]|uniref:acetyltransferase n=1 Tax=Fusobacterium russii TaxID=854 RepID=UPI00039B1F81|nr:acetyltransferase [Fusobacterium russii]